MSRHITCCFGTRPEAIKLFPVVDALGRGGAAVRTVCTGQHQALLDLCIDLFSSPPDVRLDLFASGQPLAALVGRAVDAVAVALRGQPTDAVVVQGDTATTLAAALAAFYEGIPLVHVEAGLRTGDLEQPYPEEMHRQVVARIAELHLAPTESARDNLLAEGIASDRIVVTGNTGLDALRLVAARAESPDIPGLAPDSPYVVATVHRRETAAMSGAIALALREVSEAVNLPLVVVLHPNAGLSDPIRRALAGSSTVVTVSPMAYPRMIGLLRGATALLTDSGGLQEEASALGVPTLVLRDRSARHESVDTGNARIVGRDPTEITAWFTRIATDPGLRHTMAVPTSIYGDGNAATRVAAAILDLDRWRV